jgi:Zn-finger nucleic acid-binding protein
MEKKLVMDLFNIDRCPTCEGVWFDKGELHAIEQKAKEKGFSEGFLLGFIM